MSDLTNAYEEEIYEALRADTPFVALFTVAPTESTAGTEVTGGSYARQAVTLPAYNSGVGGGTIASAINFPTATAAWGTVVAVGIFDAVSGGNLRFYKAITPQVVGDTESVRFDAGNLTVSFN